MLTIKDAKEFRGLNTKAMISKAKEIGETFSEGTAMAKIAMMALAAGLDAKERGDKTFKFAPVFDAFAVGYYANVQDSTLGTYRSAYSRWTEAGMLAKWDATDVAVRVFNEGQYDLSKRSGMLARLLKLEAPPNAKQYAAAKPPKRNNNADATYAEASAAFVRYVGNFAVKWDAEKKEMTKAQTVLFAAVVKAANEFLAGVPQEEPKTKGKKAPVAKPSPAKLRAAQEAKFLALLSKSSPEKTIQ